MSKKIYKKKKTDFEYGEFNRPWLKWVPNQEKYYGIAAVLITLVGILFGAEYAFRGIQVFVWSFVIICIRDGLVSLLMDDQPDLQKAWWNQTPENENENEVVAKESESKESEATEACWLHKSF